MKIENGLFKLENRDKRILNEMHQGLLRYSHHLSIKKEALMKEEALIQKSILSYEEISFIIGIRSPYGSIWAQRDYGNFIRRFHLLFLCPYCEGKGGNTSVCSHCNGSGYNPSVKRDGGD